MIPGLGKLLIIVGVLLVIFGFSLVYLISIPWLGKLPGDILVKRDNFSFYLPITTCLVLSVIWTVVFHFLRK